jgi:hypothetical protein
MIILKTATDLAFDPTDESTGLVVFGLQRNSVITVHTLVFAAPAAVAWTLDMSHPTIAGLGASLGAGSGSGFLLKDIVVPIEDDGTAWLLEFSTAPIVGTGYLHVNACRYDSAELS